MQGTFRFEQSMPTTALPVDGVVGRGAGIRPANPHVAVRTETETAADDPSPSRRLPTRHEPDATQSLVNRNDSPDLPFRWTLNPYRGCEHGCSYCYARPTHEFLGYDAGLAFESRLLVKHAAAPLLKKWLARPEWQGEPIVFSGVTDCYQPAEREYRLTRACLEVAEACGQPVAIVTKNALVTRDIDLLASLAERQAAVVAISLTTLDPHRCRSMEPRTSTPAARLNAIRELATAGIPVHAMLSPTIPGLNDHEASALLAAAAEQGATSASYTLLRLPGAVREVFLEWLDRCEPTFAPKVRQLIGATRGGRFNDTRFHHRMTGIGPYAAHIARTFRVFAARNRLARTPLPLSRAAFRHPSATSQQRLFC
ncbi:PA0069 family radical SAM protein [Botrimarina hoheduenensis]|uniref:Radical SAM superfamily protein n=1 Tax=Botrimarina hoheduenensis TaxID=2528000 RepID=A0A5C5W6Y7_9BACT|nr:PA0069 family radical SAM protein [Botrimarina hoheduenensis]TWT46656.1 Radical SAM superfamily protein [Botrimarina hoheduenensis]